jgi:hypothetical protein
MTTAAQPTALALNSRRHFTDQESSRRFQAIALAAVAGNFPEVEPDPDLAGE